MDSDPSKLSPIRITKSSPLKTSPKKVHFSPDIENPRRSSPSRFEVTEDSYSEDSRVSPEFIDSAKSKRVKEKEKISPLKLKIKFGKDKTGTITHGKIKS